MNATLTAHFARTPLPTIGIACLSVLSICFSTALLAQVADGSKLRLPAGFEATLVYGVPQEQGSWVCITPDPQGRLITSDQYGKLYRVTPGAEGAEPKIEKIPLSMGFAQGLLCAFDSLYVVAHDINDKEANAKRPAGLYRLRDTDNDDMYDEVKLLRQFNGRSEHGPHAVILSPDKKSLYVCGGNHTELPNPETSRVPQVWQEDQVLTRFNDAGGHAVGKMAPGGWICQTDPDGKSFELVSMGYRNEYDIAFDPNGELFTYDADMEWDVGLPWYRPTRVCHAISGSEFGWRHGSGKWPEYYADSMPPVHNVGPGSPTGIAFGTGAKFPATYQNALFIADWSYGMIYAIHLEPNGSSYKATQEKFCSAPALPVTDLVINPADGAMYFLIGGRRSQSALYRVAYKGDESTAPAAYPEINEAVQVRRQLESYHQPGATIDMDFIWEQLGSPDRVIRFAARTAIEHQPVASWMSRFESEQNPQRVLELATALARCGTADQQAAATKALSGLTWESLSKFQRLHLLRAYGLVLCRMGEPSRETLTAIHSLQSNFPAADDQLDRELGKLLVAANNPAVTPQLVEILLSPAAQETQIAVALILSDASVGWTDELREKYFQWFFEAQKSRGGNSFGGYLANIRQHAIDQLPDASKTALASLLEKKPSAVDPYADLKARPLVKQWKMDDLLPLEDEAFVGRDLENGKKMFAIASCYRCHRIGLEGGIVGPDLTPAGRRFSTHDLLEAIIDPNKAISDQYEATMFAMEDGQVITGRVANLSGNEYWIQQDMIDPGNFTKIKADQIDEMQASKVSMMPAGLLDNMTKDEILDLLAYLKSTAPLDTEPQE